MNKKQLRQHKISKVIETNGAGITITGIYEALFSVGYSNLSRKTVERDICEMIEQGTIIQLQENPLKVIHGPNRTRTMTLSLNDIEIILASLQMMNDQESFRIIDTINSQVKNI